MEKDIEDEILLDFEYQPTLLQKCLHHQLYLKWDKKRKTGAKISTTEQKGKKREQVNLN